MEIKIANSTAELQQILELQAHNHLANVPESEWQREGFVTVMHELPLLEQMSARAGQVVALDQGRVVGYALSMLQEFRDQIPVLVPMFRVFDEVNYGGQPLSAYPYYVMGQICIAASHRGQGLFEAMYHRHREQFAGEFDLCLTLVSTRNPRSMRAHERLGFQVLHTFDTGTDLASVLCWDWRPNKA